MAEILAKRNTSAFTIALAESNKKNGQSVISNLPDEGGSNSWKKSLIVISSLIFIVGGIFGLYYIYSINSAPTSIPIANTAQKNVLIPTDLKVNIPININDPLNTQTQIMAELAKDQKPGTIKEILLTTTSTSTDKNQTVQTGNIPAQTLIINLGINMPDILFRSLNNEWMIGEYANNQGQKSIFVMVSDNFYQNAFAGMLQWESVMADDIKKYIVPPTTAPVTDFSSTGGKTTTGYNPNYLAIHGRFIDKNISNKDIREFVTDNGGVAFLYSFLDNNRLIFTSDENLIGEVTSRLERQSYLR